MLKIIIPQAMSIYINELVYSLKSQSVNITTLSLGEAFFDLPKINFDKYDNDELVHYTSSRGHPDLSKALVRMYSKNYDCKINTDNLIISAGSKILIYMSLLATRHLGSKVALLDPAWLSYVEQCKLSGLKPCQFDWETSLISVAESLDENFSALVINNPNNPGGFIYSYDEMVKTIEICSKKGISVIIDEAYSDFTSPGSGFKSMSQDATKYKNVIVVNSLSKNLGMSGFRVGYAISTEDNIDQLVKLNQHLITCAPTILQKYVADALDKILVSTKPQIENILEKRQRLMTILDEKGLTAMPGSSTFYFMLNMDNVDDVFNFALKLLLIDKIAVVPGEAYGPSTKKFVRVSIGTETVDDITNAFSIIKDRISNGWPDKNISTKELLNKYNLKEM